MVHFGKQSGERCTASRFSLYEEMEESLLKSTWTSRFTSFLFILPYLAAFGLFLLFPILYGFVISLQDFELLSDTHPFVGLRNYITIFTPERMRTAFSSAACGPPSSLSCIPFRC